MGKESIYIKYIHASDEECLSFIFGDRERECNKCKSVTKFYPVKNRKCFECGNCGYQIYPLKQTIMKNTKLPLNKWFIAIWEMGYCNNGFTTHNLSRKLGIGYRATFSLTKKIRMATKDNPNKILTGVVEVDESYFSGKMKIKKKGDHSFSNKETLFGMREKDGQTMVFSVERRDKETIIPLIEKYIKLSSIVHTDEHPIYSNLSKIGYTHDFVRHKDYQFAKGKVTTNRIENVWSTFKSHFRANKHISKKYLPIYIDEFLFKFNRRDKQNPNKAFDELIERIVKEPFHLEKCNH